MDPVWWPKPHGPQHLWGIPRPAKEEVFFDFPRISRQCDTYEAAGVFLLNGMHWVLRKGFGYVQISEGHWREIGLSKKAAAPHPVSIIVATVAEICGQRVIFLEISGPKHPGRSLS